MQIHPSDILLREILEEPLCPSQKVRDHLGECALCRKRIRNLLAAPRRPSSHCEYALGSNIEFIALWQRRLTLERAQAPRLLSVLLEQPEARRELLVRNHPRFQTWGLLELTLEQSHEQTFNNPAGSEEMGNLALLVSDHLSPSLYGLERIEDLRARAWAYIGNSLRVRVNLAGAEKAFEKAFAHLRRGTGEVLERASILRLKGALRKDQHRFADSLHLLQRTIQIFRETGDEHQVGSSLVSMSTIHHLQGEPDRAILLVNDALPRLDFRREPRIVACAHINLVGDLVIAGRFMEAQGTLARNRALYQQLAEPWLQSGLHYVQGAIYLKFGLYREAKTHLQLAYEAFLGANRPAIAAEVSEEILALPRS
jgi:tetratricopeptide (TPR) repeat protein